MVTGLLTGTDAHACRAASLRPLWPGGSSFRLSTRAFHPRPERSISAAIAGWCRACRASTGHRRAMTRRCRAAPIGAMSATARASAPRRRWTALAPSRQSGRDAGASGCRLQSRLLSPSHSWTPRPRPTSPRSSPMSAMPTVAPDLPRTKLIQARIEETDLPDASFDIVHSCHTIEHLAAPFAGAEGSCAGAEAGRLAGDSMRPISR